jgi:hypothetical protein
MCPSFIPYRAFQLRFLSSRRFSIVSLALYVCLLFLTTTMSAAAQTAIFYPPPPTTVSAGITETFPQTTPPPLLTIQTTVAPAKRSPQPWECLRVNNGPVHASDVGISVPADGREIVEKIDSLARGFQIEMNLVFEGGLVLDFGYGPVGFSGGSETREQALARIETRYAVAFSDLLRERNASTRDLTFSYFPYLNQSLHANGNPKYDPTKPDFIMMWSEAGDEIYKLAAILLRLTPSLDSACMDL